MKATEGAGVAAVLSLLTSIAKRSTREEIRPYIDGLTDEQLADVMAAASAADVATGGTGNLLFESAAARLRGIDVGRFGSGGHHAADEE